MEGKDEEPGGGSGGGGQLTSEVVLVGCVKGKLEWASRVPAKDLYVSPLWRSRRIYAERSGLPWYILSAKYGLLDPDDRIQWYDLSLGDLPAAQRRAWRNASWIPCSRSTRRWKGRSWRSTPARTTWTSGWKRG